MAKINKKFGSTLVWAALSLFTVVLVLNFGDYTYAAEHEAVCGNNPPPVAPPAPSRAARNSDGLNKNIVKTKEKEVAKRQSKKASKNLRSQKGDFFTSPIASLDFSFGSFRDSDLKGSGQQRSTNLSIEGKITDSTTLAIGLSNSRYEIGGASSTLSRGLGGDILLQHFVTENFSVSGFGFYSEVDTEQTNPNGFSFGYGAMATFAYQLDTLDLTFSSTSTLFSTKSDFDTSESFGQFVALEKQFTDKVGTTVFATWTDSLNDKVIIDSTYFTVGADLDFQINDSSFLSIGYERILSQNDIQSNILNLVFSLEF